MQQVFIATWTYWQLNESCTGLQDVQGPLTLWTVYSHKAWRGVIKSLGRYKQLAFTPELHSNSFYILNKSLLLWMLQFPPHFTDVASRPFKDIGGQESVVTGHKIVAVFMAPALIYQHKRGRMDCWKTGVIFHCSFYVLILRHSPQGLDLLFSGMLRNLEGHIGTRKRLIFWKGHPRL